jgi:DnaA family protein
MTAVDPERETPSAAVARQLTLDLRLRDSARFGTYLAGPNAEAVRSLQAIAQEAAPEPGARQISLWGAPATGKTHLVQALCQVFAARERTCLYLPLRQFGSMPAGLLDGAGQVDLVCLDELDAIAGQGPWERAVFHLINSSRELGHVIVMASRENPARLPVGLPDLGSRLLWGPVYRLLGLEDGDKLKALQRHAAQRGFRLSREAGRYLLSRCSRDLNALVQTLDRLDRASFAAQRHVTIPFIRTVLSRSDVS